MSPLEFYKAFELIHPCVDGKYDGAPHLLARRSHGGEPGDAPEFPPADLFGVPAAIRGRAARSGRLSLGKRCTRWGTDTVFKTELRRIRIEGCSSTALAREFRRLARTVDGSRRCGDRSAHVRLRLHRPLHAVLLLPRETMHGARAERDYARTIGTPIITSLGRAAGEVSPTAWRVVTWGWSRRVHRRLDASHDPCACSARVGEALLYATTLTPAGGPESSSGGTHEQGFKSAVGPGTVDQRCQRHREPGRRPRGRRTPICANWRWRADVARAGRAIPLSPWHIHGAHNTRE